MYSIHSARNKVLTEYKQPFLIGYFLAGYRNTKEFLEILSQINSKAIDVLEIGYPSENPHADGQIISEAHASIDTSAVRNINVWRKIRKTTNKPIWLMGYAEELIHNGAYIPLAREQLIDALVIPNLKLEEQLKLKEKAALLQVDVVGFTNPDMSDEELDRVLSSNKFIYEQLYVGQTGRCPEKDQFHHMISYTLKNYPEVIPFAGFGLNNRERLQEIYKYGFKGAVIGTEMVRQLNKSKEDLFNFVDSLTVRSNEEEYQTATFDFGTTAVKFAVVNQNYQTLFSAKENIDTHISTEGYVEQEPNQWWEVFTRLLQQYPDRERIGSIICSGQMQDIIFLNEKREPLGNAILYTDQRAEGYQHKVTPHLERETSIAFNGSIPYLKFYWMKKNQSEVVKQTAFILFSPKDFITAKLTGRCITDTVTCSTTGMMNIKNASYSNELEEDLSHLLPEILLPNQIAGFVQEETASTLGICRGIPVYAGCGDAGATTLASGIKQQGDLNINLGTSGWVARLSDKPANGVFNLCAVQKDLFINVVPVLNAAAVHKWVSNMIFSHDENKYRRMDELLAEHKNYNTQLICLPYLVGERFPVADPKIRGCYIGLTPQTTLADLSLAALEGVAFSLKQGMESLGDISGTVSLIGGGALTEEWNQIFADILEKEVMTFGNSDMFPSFALADIVFSSVFHFELFRFHKHVKGQRRYIPQKDRQNLYRQKYQKFLKVYPAVKNLFSD